MSRLTAKWQALVRLFAKDIWTPASLQDRSLRGRWQAVLRVLSITGSGLLENRAASRAAALSFSSLLGLGPLVAIAMLVAGFMLNQDDPNLAVNTLNRLIKFIAPQIAQYELATANGAQLPAEKRSDVLTATNRAANTGAIAPASPAVPRASEPARTAGPPRADEANGSTAPPALDGEAPAAPLAVNPELVNLIDGFVSNSRSGTVGVIGALTLILIVIQLFTSVETAFNEIWGVRRGRSWLLRVVFYWTVLTLGAVLFFAAVTGLSAGAFLNAFAEKLPYGSELLRLLQFFLPAGSLVLLVLILTLFYRTIPNTHVFWRAAFVGALVVAILLLANNTLAFLYFRRVVLSRSLYGSLGVLPILMFGLYIFWFLVLIGGQVSYAIQNVHFRNSQAAWHNLAESMRERLSLVVLLTVCRRFHDCLPPCTASQLSGLLGVPTQLLNECLNRLVKMHLLTPIPPAPGEASTDYRYQPARPLSRITLAAFKMLDDDFGDDPTGPALGHVEPILARYNAVVSRLHDSELFQKPLDQLLNEFPIEAAHPPYAPVAPARPSA
jgi:membrane protein